LDDVTEDRGTDPTGTFASLNQLFQEGEGGEEGEEGEEKMLVVSLRTSSEPR
jgi:hypothetical protein